MRNAIFSAVVACSICGQAIGQTTSSIDVQRAQQAELSADAVARSMSMTKANGFTISDGENKLRVGGWAQFRYLMNWRDDPGPDANGDHDSGFTNGFELARTRLNVAGNVLDPNLKFKAEGDFSRSNGDFSLLDAFVGYTFGDSGFTLRGGQFKPPLEREQLVSDTAQLAIERSTVDSVFSQSRSQGVELQYAGDAARAFVMMNDGLGALNTRYNDSTEADIGVTARGEWRLAGDWKRFDDFTSWRGADTAAMLGVAGHWQHDGNTATPGDGSPGPVQQTDLFLYTADLSVEGDGWNVFAEFVGQHFDGDEGTDSLDDFGAVVQGGFFISEHDELFARWDCVFPDSDRAGNDDFNTITAGFNHYFVPESHALKFTADVCWFLDPTTDNSLVPTGGRNGLLPTAEDNEVCVRFQLQFMF
ncbi:MAG: hypothetical protein AMXMBFR58_37280 [Phycisphaerae bacterium]|nr:hypothetical protein [Phycisphaerales bacterium]